MMDSKEKKVARCFVNTFADKVGNPLFGLGYLIEKIEKGQNLTEKEIHMMSETYNKAALKRFQELSRAFKQ